MYEASFETVFIESVLLHSSINPSRTLTKVDYEYTT